MLSHGTSEIKCHNVAQAKQILPFEGNKVLSNTSAMGLCIGFNLTLLGITQHCEMRFFSSFLRETKFEYSASYNKTTVTSNPNHNELTLIELCWNFKNNKDIKLKWRSVGSANSGCVVEAKGRWAKRLIASHLVAGESIRCNRVSLRTQTYSLTYHAISKQ